MALWLLLKCIVFGKLDNILLFPNFIKKFKDFNIYDSSLANSKR
jgi:hypothetical protein